MRKKESSHRALYKRVIRAVEPSVAVCSTVSRPNSQRCKMKSQMINWPCFALLLIGFHMTNVDSVAVGQPGHFHRQQKRSVLSLPKSIFKFTGQIIVPVLSLINQTNTYLWFDFPSTWPVPNNKKKVK